MRSRSGHRTDRSQSTVLGAILLFGFLILAVTAWQISVVPAQNAEVEYGHNQQVHEQMQELRSRMVSASAGGGGGTVDVPLGTTYPDRTIYRNPQPPVGQLRTVSGGGAVTLNVSNATPVDGETADFWGTELSYDTALVTYRPGYHEYEGAPTTVLDNTLLYDRYDSTTLARSPQSLVDGTRLSLLVASGNVSETRSGVTEDLSLQVTPTSSSTNTVRIRNDSGPVTLTVTSYRSAEFWNETLAADGQLDEDGGYVTGVANRSTLSVDGETLYRVGITLAANETYAVQATRVHVGTTGEPDPSAPGPAYVTVVDGDGASVEAGSSREFTVEVRDRYHNPVADATVNLSLDGTGTLTADGTSGGRLTDLDVGDDGRVTVRYDAPATVTTPTDVTVNVSRSGDAASGFEAGTPPNATVALTVTPGDGGGNGSSGGGPYTVEWDRNGTVTVDRTATPTATLTARIVEGLGNQPVEFAVNDTSVARVASADARTDGSGAADATVDLRSDGTFLAYVTSGGSGDRLLVEVVSGGVSPLVWQTAADWDAATSAEGVVHAGYGDRMDSVVLLGNGPGDAGLVGYWSLDEDGGGTATDATGNGRDMSVPAGVAQGRTGIAGASAYEFPGDERIEDGDGEAYLNDLTDFTTSVWVRSDQVGTDNGIYGGASPDAEDNVFALRYDDVGFFGGGDDVLKAAISVDTDGDGFPDEQMQLESESGVQTTGWQHVVVTRTNGGPLRMYVNGTEVGVTYLGDGNGNSFGGSGYPTGPVEDASTFFLGESTKNDGRWDGRLDEVRLYDRALSPSEVAALYNGTAAPGSGEYRGEVVTDWRSFSTDVDPTTLTLVNASAIVPSGSSGVEVVVESDVDGDGTVDETGGTLSLSNGTSDYAVPDGGLSQQSSRYRLRVVLAASDPTVTPCFAGTALASGSGNVTVGTGDCPVATNPPTASVTATPSAPTTRETLSVDGSGSTDDGSVVSYEWAFGDGTTATGPTASHTYAQPGTYTVTLTVTDDDGLTDTTTRTVTVRPAALLTAVQPNPDALGDNDGEFVAVEVDGPFDTSDWVVRDDESGTGAVRATFPATADGRLWFVRNVTAFERQWSVPADVTLVEFDPGGTGLLANGGEPLELVNTSNGQVIDEFAYGSASTSNGWSYGFGDTTGRVAVRDGDGSGWYVDTNASSDWADVAETDFFDPAPNASFDYTPDTVHSNESVTFDGSPSTVAGTGSYEWEFGDGGTATGQSVSHTFDSPGTYTVTLTVTDANGATDTTTRTVNVGGPIRDGDGETLTGGTADSVVAFSLANNASTDFDVTGITVEATGGSTQLREPCYTLGGGYEASELMIDQNFSNGFTDPNDGYAETLEFTLFGCYSEGFAHGTEITETSAFDWNTPVVPAGQNTSVLLVEFQDGSNDPVSMAGEEVTVTVTVEYADGTTDTETFTYTL